jgi:hypothetical protein
MIDYQNLPNNSTVDWFMQPTATNEVHTWNKPSGCNFVYMVAVGGGGAGGNGFTRVPNSNGGGGGGGQSAFLQTLLVPAFLIPDTLFIKIGNGGKTGGTGGNTIVSAYRVSSVTEYFLNAGGGQTGGNGSATVAGGTSTTTNPFTNSTLASIGKWQSITTNIRGIQGGLVTGGAGGNNTFDFIISSGASGAGTGSSDFAGGSMQSAYGQVSAVTVVQGGAAVAGATEGQNNGGDGFFIPKRFASYGGAGGGASNTGVGGKGGKGGPGCGGGGGGAGVTGGLGGDGGDGFALIISY